MPSTNEFGQLIGPALPGWTVRPHPSRTPMIGRTCVLEPLDAQKHAADIFRVNADDEGGGWTYMSVGPFASLDDYRAWCVSAAKIDDPLQFAIIDQTSGKGVGTASFMRIDPPNGVIEVGGIKYSPRLQRTIAATEAMFLMMKRAFNELGYRRYEWKCDNFNEPSKKAALRLGFIFEGVFRNAVITKGRSRDTAWFSITDSEWPNLKSAFEEWLAPENFTSDGQQKQKLSALIARTR